MAVVDATFPIDLQHHDPSALGLARAFEDRAEPLYIPSVTAVEVALGSPDPEVAWADLRDNFTVVSFTDDLAEESVPLARRLRRAGRWPGWPDFIVAATALAYGETLVSADHMAYRGIPGLRLHLYR